ncbi:MULTISPECIES: hypothetical protein [unclassified Streptomyces]|uniref:hypothetical protein n=1 Tax=unclassified Streptomyces TaxID=2593676 RepID=UPI002DD9474B|nr:MULTISPECIES: hypothetical protein [unclassified Streptomyces]WSA95949.1 hypothetical protein OIE63_33615 [Streptomyces sp. NBC_01795]WSB80364.1 hypothetical protein OHB04_34730 [Streptomyces sp. NBC_01775]WSS40139.1 hypothetical protein OG220_05630 [Streptomyces sp. NBC_01187]
MTADPSAPRADGQVLPCALCTDYQQMIRSAKNRDEPDLAEIHEHVLALHQKAKHS